MSAAPRERTLSGIELALGACIVIGHNVYRVVPNEVPILFLMALASRWWRGAPYALGFQRPASWRRVLIVALAAAALRILAGEYLVEPITSRFWPPIVAPEGTSEIAGNLPYALAVLVFVWGFAAFGEEIGYRGYLLRRAADMGGGSRASWWVGVLVVAILFGYGHYYKGPAGILDSGVAGAILGAAYLVTGRNLWAAVLAHGFIDTFGISMVYLGLDS